MHDTESQYSGVTAVVEVITPEVARHYLKKNLNNRQMRPHKVESYARDMAAGQWELTGSGIQFERTGRLIDGQNRLSAVIRANVSIPFLVVRGLEPSAQEHIDRGSGRSLSDALTMRGEKQSASLAGALAVIWRIREGKVSTLSDIPTDAELLSLLEDEPTIRKSLVWIHPCRFLASPSAIVGLHYLFSERDPVAADAFFSKLGHGDHLSRQEPVYLLRERLVRNSWAKMKLPRIDLWALMIKTWNATRQDKRLRRLVWISSGLTSETFPSIAS